VVSKSRYDFLATDFTDSHGFIYKKSVEIREIRGKKIFARDLLTDLAGEETPKE